MNRYWCEERRTGEIEVTCQEPFGDALRQGKAVQFYSGGFRRLKSTMQQEFPEAEVWYTERNGDGIALLVPLGTPPDQFPTVAMDYHAFEWIDPDKDFGTGIRPGKHDRKEGQ